MRVVALVVILFVSGCGGGRDAASFPGDDRTARAQPAGACPVSRQAAPAGRYGDPNGLEVILGDATIIALPPATEPPEGASLVAEGVRRDGSIGVKFPWFRAPGRSGFLSVSGRRVDGAPGTVHGQYGRENRRWTFQPGALVFSGEGCWEVTGRAGDLRLTFVVSVLNCVEPPFLVPPLKQGRGGGAVGGCPQSGECSYWRRGEQASSRLSYRHLPALAVRALVRPAGGS